MSRARARLSVVALVAPLMLGLVGCSNPDSTPESGTGLEGPRGLAPVREKDKQDAAVAALLTQQTALDTYVAAGQAQTAQVLETFDGMYSDFRIMGIYPGTVEYGYVYSEPVDPAAVVEYFESMIPTLQGACDAQLFPDMSNAGITIDPEVRYAYYNADGSYLWSHTFAPS